MAKAISDDELQLKKRARRRLVGAIALVLLVIVFLPMFLDSEPKPQNQDIAINIPPVPSAETVTAPRTEGTASGPVQAPTSPTATQNADAAVAESPPATPGPSRPESTAEPKTVLPKDAAKAAAKPAPRPAPAVAKSAKTESNSKPESPTVSGDEAYMVQLGAFSNAANARALQKKLQDNRFKAHTETVKAAGGERTRVRVGPYPSREAAEKARDRLKALKLVVGEATVVQQGE